MWNAGMDEGRKRTLAVVTAVIARATLGQFGMGWPGEKSANENAA